MGPRRNNHLIYLRWLHDMKEANDKRKHPRHDHPRMGDVFTQAETVANKATTENMGQIAFNPHT